MKQVFSIEIVDELILRATCDLQRLGYQNILVKSGDGYQGWPEFAPFDAITVAAALDHIPPPLTSQLREGGRLVIPIGNAQDQQLLLVEKQAEDCDGKRSARFDLFRSLGKQAIERKSSAQLE